MSINAIIQNLAQIISNTSAFSTVEAERQSSGQLPLAPGQPVQAEILANLPNNRFLARIAGELFKMELPIIVQPGETLNMTFVTGEPRPTFSLSASGNNGTPVQLSDIGKWLSRLAGSTLAEEQTTVLPRRNIILNGPPDDTGVLAGQLRDSLTLSGVFYESHLLRCFLGERQLRDILREPQGKLADISKGKLKAKSPVDRASVEEEEFAAGLIEHEPTESSRNGNRPETCGSVHPWTERIIKDQLQTLSSGVFAWQGQVWPEQEMDWTVCEREARKGETTGKVWETTLNLKLPNMGGINSLLQLDEDGLRLHIRTDRSSSADAMQLEKEALAQALAEAGVKLVEMVVEHEEHGT